MKLQLLFPFLFLILFSTYCRGQIEKKIPVYLKEEKKYVDLNENSIINTKNIKNVTILKQQNSLKLFGKKAKNGAILITLFDSITLIKLPAFLSLNKISASIKDSVFIDTLLVKYSESIFVDHSEVKNIVVDSTSGKTQKRIIINTISFQKRKEYLNGLPKDKILYLQ